MATSSSIHAASPTESGKTSSLFTFPASQPEQAENPDQSKPMIQIDPNLIQQKTKKTISMFGDQLFNGNFSSTSGTAFNENYIISTGDNLQLRLWGAYQFSGTLTVDPQGNIFIPNVGPVLVSGIKNNQLQALISQAVRTVYRANVGIYAALEQAQPIKVYVTGFVTRPGSYGGVSNDSILAYLDRAGGVDTDRGSYIDIEIRRSGQVVQHVNLYDFLLAGNLKTFVFKDGDIVIVSPKKSTFEISGDVYNPYVFEFDRDQLTVAQALTVARVKPSATHISISRRQGTEYRSEYYPIQKSGHIVLNNGDKINVTADRYFGTIQIRIEGAHAGEHAVVLPYGATLDQVIAQLKPNQMSNIDGIQLYRKSVAERQKEMLNVSLNKLEEATYSVRSSTTEEASLRIKDAELIQKFIDKARSVEPKGQVVLNQIAVNQMTLEDGDIIVIPEKTSVVMLHGEVLFPNAVAWQAGRTITNYIDQVGGYTQTSDKSKIILIRPTGQTELATPKTVIQQGDQIMILPKVSTKRIEVARGISQILYQIAIASKVVFGL
jgi:protein involved in polysaccharide export with SLBB domain